MPLTIVKLLSEDSKAELAAAIAAYKGAAGAELLDTQRAMASYEFVEADGDIRTSVCLAHAGLDIPASGAKTADLQHLVVRKEGTLAELQTEIDETLAQATHATVTDADTTTPGTVTSVTAPFEAEDVGRLIEIGGVQKEITVYNAANSVDYDNADGDFASGSGLTLELLGAEVIQDMHMSLMKSRGGEHQLHMLMAVEGEAY
jgi:hypothetical protein